MKHLLIIVAAMLMHCTLFAQLELKVKELKVSSINTKFSENAWIEGENEGPYLKLICSIRNTSDTAFTLHLIKTKYFIVFNYKGKRYTDSPLRRFEYDTLTLKKNEEVDVFLETSLLLGTSILKRNSGDYTQEMLQILPTIKVVLEERNRLKLVSSEIVNVVIQ